MKRTYFKKTKRLFENVNAEKSSGLCFSVAIVAQYVFLLAVMAIAYLCGSLTEGYTEKTWYLYCSFLIPQAAFLVTAYFYFTRTEVSFKEVVKKPRAAYIVAAIAVQFGLLSLSKLNVLFVEWLNKFGYRIDAPAIPSLQGARLIPAIIVIAVLPAFLEELFFRGILFCGMKKFGSVAAVLVSAALFALYHQNPAQTIYQFICGVCFALIAIRSGSILPTVISHFFNNALILVLSSCGINDFPLWVLIVLGVVLVLSISYLLFFDKNAEKTKKEGENPSATLANARSAAKSAEKTADVKGFILCALTGIVFCAMNWIAALLGNG